MQLLDRTFPTPQENLACDEALLKLCEEGSGSEILRFWEPRDSFVVVGYSNKVDLEVNRNSCRAHHIPILRRCTGGGTVLQGPGCLNYSLVLRIDGSQQFQSISKTNCAIMTRHRDALRSALGEPVEIEGHTDLAIDGMKFSGNSQRRGRRCVLFHGTFLLQLDLGLMEMFLPLPSREPAYRQGRDHGGFLMNLNVPATRVKAVLTRSWGAAEPFLSTSWDRTEQLAREKYSSAEWNNRF